MGLKIMGKLFPDIDFWKRRGIPDPVTEFKFHPTRRWRFDYCWVKEKVAIEINGGVWIKGRHTRGAGQIKDMEKLNEAQRMGYDVYQFTPQQLPLESTAEFLRGVLI